MKLFSTLALLLFFSSSFSQWTRVRELPSTDIASLYHKDNILYAGGKNIIYISKDNGLTWDSTSSNSKLFLVTSIIVYKNELYAAAPSNGVFKSPDEGATWQDITEGIFPDISDFFEWRGDLYAATLGNSVYKLDPITRKKWLPHSNGLSSISANTTTISGNNNAMVAGTLANGLYDYLPANSTTWEERFLRGRISPTEGIYDIITAHDSLFLSGHTGRIYMSKDNGLQWEVLGDVLTSLNTTLVNAREALLLSTIVFDGINFITVFYYVKKESLQDRFVQFSFLLNHFAYKIDILGDRIWDASNKGLFYMSLSDLPGISAVDDFVSGELPVHFISFSSACDKNKVILTWKTADEQNSRRFDIERSVDGVRWTVIGNEPAAFSTSNGGDYSFTDINPLQNGYYRIVEYDLDGKAEYTETVQSKCDISDEFRLWPNPTPNMVFINITAENISPVVIRVFDSKGALVKMQRATVMSGSNQLNVDLTLLPVGVYSLTATWNNGQIRKSAQVLKQ